jgi:hypothetical protein
MPRGWLLLLCVYLAVWRPLNVAAEVTGTLSTLAMRGPAALLELSIHAAVGALALAAGWAMSIANPNAPMLARIALAACAATSVQSLYWTSLPDNIMPGDRLPLAVAAIAHAAGWITYLGRSRRVRALFLTS